jgi:hypothetical protein
MNSTSLSSGEKPCCVRNQSISATEEEAKLFVPCGSVILGSDFKRVELDVVFGASAEMAKNTKKFVCDVRTDIRFDLISDDILPLLHILMAQS